jgi:hypothetical protein
MLSSVLAGCSGALTALTLAGATAAAPPLLNISLVPSCATANPRPGAAPACSPATTQSSDRAGNIVRPWPWPHGGAPTVNGSVALGDIRAVVHAEAAGQPLTAQVWWRRRDSHPTIKAVIVTGADDVPLPSVATHVEADCGVVSFTPPAVGDYYVYYLPCPLRPASLWRSLTSIVLKTGFCSLEQVRADRAVRWHTLPLVQLHRPVKRAIQPVCHRCARGCCHRCPPHRLRFG